MLFDLMRSQCQLLPFGYKPNEHNLCQIYLLVTECS